MLRCSDASAASAVHSADFRRAAVAGSDFAIVRFRLRRLRRAIRLARGRRSRPSGGLTRIAKRMSGTVVVPFNDKGAEWRIHLGGALGCEVHGVLFDLS